MPEANAPEVILSPDRKDACLRGLRFIYRHSLGESHFEEWAGDYLWCFRCVAFTSRDEDLRSLALEMGTASARRWMAAQTEVPQLADAGEVAYYASLLHSCGLFGVTDQPLRRLVEEAIPRFTARDYLCFDPSSEPPSAVAGRSSSDVWSDALVTVYTGEGFGTPLGASYAAVLRWLPQMRPWLGYEGGANPEFRDTLLAITHLVYTLNDYGRYRLSPEWLPEEFAFLCSNMQVVLKMGDAELLGEFVDCLRCFGVADIDSALLKSLDFLLSTQNSDGSWGDPGEPDEHKRYHTAWTAIDALRDNDWADRLPPLTVG